MIVMVFMQYFNSNFRKKDLNQSIASFLKVYPATLNQKIIEDWIFRTDFFKSPRVFAYFDLNQFFTN